LRKCLTKTQSCGRFIEGRGSSDKGEELKRNLCSIPGNSSSSGYWHPLKVACQ
jgi:hypothetical protein